SPLETLSELEEQGEQGQIDKHDGCGTLMQTGPHVATSNVNTGVFVTHGRAAGPLSTQNQNECAKAHTAE
ncbi:UNVERIFIED_CONTAM: hypothetical protein K2H54_069274, partial [Gekko kuhli]